LTPRAVYLRQERFTRDFEQVSHGRSPAWFQERSVFGMIDLATLFQKLL
jgi:hypothetical protein